MEPTFFATPAEFRRWLKTHHQKETELWVGFHKRKSGRPSLTWPQSVDEALCFGWIDGLRRSIDADAYAIRFTPRKRGSTWSAVNTRRAKELIEAGRMQPAGLRAFEARTAEKTGIYSFEQRKNVELDAKAKAQLKANGDAWAFFQSQPPWYRRTAVFWIMSAKKEETRARRLAALIEDSAAGRRVRPLSWNEGKSGDAKYRK